MRKRRCHVGMLSVRAPSVPLNSKHTNSFGGSAKGKERIMELMVLRSRPAAMGLLRPRFHRSPSTTDSLSFPTKSASSPVETNLRFLQCPTMPSCELIHSSVFSPFCLVLKLSIELIVIVLLKDWLMWLWQLLIDMLLQDQMQITLKNIYTHWTICCN